MSVQIIITGEDAGHALIELTTFSAGQSSGQAIQQAKTVAPQPEKPKRGTAKAAEQEKSEPPAAEPESEPEIIEAEDTPPPADDDAPIPDDVELRAAASAKGKTPEGKAAVKALLTKYGVPNITAVPKDKRVAFLAELNAI